MKKRSCLENYYRKKTDLKSSNNFWFIVVSATKRHHFHAMSELKLCEILIPIEMVLTRDVYT